MEKTTPWRGNQHPKLCCSYKLPMTMRFEEMLEGDDDVRDHLGDRPGAKKVSRRSKKVSRRSSQGTAARAAPVVSESLDAAGDKKADPPRVPVYLSKNDKKTTIWGKYDAFFTEGPGVVHLQPVSLMIRPMGASGLLSRDVPDSGNMSVKLPGEFYFNPTQDLLTMPSPARHKSKSRNLRNAIHSASKCPIYSLRMQEKGPDLLVGYTPPYNDYVLGVEAKHRGRLEKLWNQAAVETLTRKFVANTATAKDYKSFRSVWKRYHSL